MEEPIEISPPKPKEEKKAKVDKKKENTKTLDENVLEDDDIDFASDAPSVANDDENVESSNEDESNNDSGEEDKSDETNDDK